MSKIDTLIKKIDKYIIDHKLCINDPDEDEYGQCVDSFSLADAIGADTLGKLTLYNLWSLADNLSNHEVSYRGHDYGEIFGVQLRFSDIDMYDITVEIWDGC